MKYFLQHAILTVRAGRTTPAIREWVSSCGYTIGRIVLSMLLLVFMSNTAFADHFKGGHFSYKPLGEGKYEFLIKGYWDKNYVSNVYLRCEGSPKIHGFPITLSKTLLADGETVEHVQKYTVSWSEPGNYDVYWENCCRGVGANFNGNKSRLFGVINYDPAAPSSSPKFYDFFALNFEVGQSINYNINAEDPDGHEQEVSLEIPFDLSADAYTKMQETGFQVKQDGTILWEKPVEGKWAVNIRLREKIDGIYTGAYVDREYIINVVSENNQAPVFTPIEAKAVKAGESLSFEIEAADVEGQNVTLTANGSPFENGAGFTQTEQGSLAKGTFSWTPPTDAIGTYKIQLVATDNASTPLSSYVNVAITVAECKEFIPAYNIAAQPCAGSSNGKITLSATEGFSPYLYSLDNGISYQSSSDFENLAAGNYSGVVKDAIGCISEPVEIVLEEVPLPEVTLELPVMVCANATALELAGGSPAGGNYEGTGVADGFFYPEMAGVGMHTIYYAYKDGNGCSNTASKEIMVSEVPVADAGADTVVYSGAGARGCTTLTAGATGGTSPYSYQWSTGESSQSIEVCPTETTTYILTVTDASGCSDTSEVTVTVQEARNNDNKPDWAGGKPGKGAMSANARSNAIAEKPTTLSEITTAEVVVFPNPITDGSQLKIRFEEADWITVDIIDLSGRVVKNLYTGNIEAKQALSFGLNSHLGKEKFYICRLITSKGVHSFKLIMQ